MKRGRIAIGVLVVLAAGAAAWWAGWPAAGSARRPAHVTAPRPVPVTIGSAVRKAMPVQLEAVGTVRPVQSVVVRARVDSTIDQVHFNAGDMVQTGAILFTLDSRQIQAQLQQAVATLARDQAQLVLAQRELARNTDLAARSVVAQTTLDQARAQAQSYEATVRADQAAIDNMRVQITYYTIAAPIAGRIGAVQVTAGNNVRASDATALATINQVDPIYVAFAVPERRLPELQAARTQNSLRLAATPPGGRAVNGTLAYLDNAVDAESGTIMVTGSFANADELLVPGQFVTVTVTLRVEPNAVVVPATAVQVGQDGPYVFIVKPDRTVAMQAVTVARTQNGESVIASGLDGGEQVVVDGQLRVTIGTVVEPQQPAAAAPAAGTPAPAAPAPAAAPQNAPGRS